MAGTDEKWTIDKLDNKNWITWKFRMRHLLLAIPSWGEKASEVIRSEVIMKALPLSGPMPRGKNINELWRVLNVVSPDIFDGSVPNSSNEWLQERYAEPNQRRNRTLTQNQRLGAFTAATKSTKRHKWLIHSGESSHNNNVQKGHVEKCEEYENLRKSA